MNTNHERRDDELELSAEQRMQALLCAYVLGEASEAERAEVDAALAKSPELRAAKARLEATVPVVAGVLKERAGEALSPQSKSELDAAAARRARPTFFSQPIVRLAAGVAIAAGVWAIYRSGSSPAPRDGSSVNGLEVAVAPEGQDADEKRQAEALKNPAPAEPQSAARPERDALAARAGETATPELKKEITGFTLERLDQGVVNTRASHVAVGGNVVAPSVSSTAPPPARGLDQAKHKQESSGVAPRSSSAAQVSAPGAAGGGKFAGRLGGGEKLGLSDGAGVAGGGAPASPGSPARTRSKDEELKALVQLGYGGGLDQETAAEERVTGTDDFFLGRGEQGRFQKGDEGDRSLGQPTEVDHLRQRYRHIHDHCVLPVGPTRPRDMFFRYWGDNPFELTLLDRQSTFSIDVDTASYTLARRYLVDGQLPTKEQIRTEEFVNYFKGDVPPPTEGTFAVATEFAPSLFGDDNNTWMLRVAVRGKDVSKAERQPVALTFVVDVSGSMREGARLELVKHSLRLLVSQMDASDSIALVKFSNTAALILPMTSARQKDLIESAIHPLQPEGSTNTEAGLRMGYEQALAALTPNANNRVVLLTDGVANVGLTDPDALVQMVERQRKAGIYLNTVGVGMNNHNDNLLEQLAGKGDGLCNYVDDEQEVRRALVDNFTGAFQVIARDVKIQVEFDPAQVERYRLLGYENRAIADADFRNDKVDAGEVGAGHQVVALYEVVRRSVTGDGPLATVRLRWKPPFQVGVAENEQGATQESAYPVQASSAAASFAATSPGYRRSVLVAQFAEFLRRSVHARRDSLERLIDEARRLSREFKDKDFDEFVDMTVRAKDLIQAELARRDWLDECGYLLRHRHYLHCQFDDLRKRFPQRFEDPRYAAELEQQLRDMDLRLAELQQRVEAERGAADEELVGRLQAENIELQRRLIAQLEAARQVEGR